MSSTNFMKYDGELCEDHTQCQGHVPGGAIKCDNGICVGGFKKISDKNKMQSRFIYKKPKKSLPIYSSLAISVIVLVIIFLIIRRK